MNCPKCGTPNKAKATFCCECGAQLVCAKEKKKISKLKVGITVTVLGIIAISIAAFMYIGKRSENVNLVKKQFMEYWEQKDYKSAYGMLEITEDEWISEAQFEKRAKYMDISKSDLKLKRQKEKSGSFSVNGRYPQMPFWLKKWGYQCQKDQRLFLAN